MQGQSADGRCGTASVLVVPPQTYEHWVVVDGTATVHLSGKILTLEAGKSIDIPLGAYHALGNDTDAPVIVIEVQMGSYFGEDDIVRVSDL